MSIVNRYTIWFMKKLLSLTLLFIPLAVFAKVTLSGNWIEVKRMKLDKSVVAYKDTIHLKFMVGNEYVWQKSGGFTYRGTFRVTDKDLDLGMRDFAIVQKTPDKLVLQDDDGIYELAPDNTVAQQQTAALKPEAPAAPVNSINQMVGHWSVYKRTSAQVLKDVDYTRILKMIDITGGSSDGKLGYLYAAKDADNAPSWTIDSYSDQTLHCSGRDKREFKVLKCENNDMVLEEDGITYFFKQFR